MIRRLSALVALSLGLASPVAAQYGAWTNQNGAQALRVNTPAARPAVSIRQDGAGDIFAAYAGTTKVWSIAADGSLPFTQPFYGALGSACTAATIPYSINGDSDTGLTSVAANSLSQCAGATEITRATTTFFKSFLPINIPDGLVGAPAIAFTSDPNTGFTLATSHAIGIVTNGLLRAQWINNHLQIASDNDVSWTSTSDPNGTKDLTIGRLGAGQLLIENDSTHGVSHDYSTDGTDYCKSRAGADTCILKANALTATGAVTASGGVTTLSGSDVTSSGSVLAGGTSKSIYWSGSSVMKATADGLWQVTNNGGSFGPQMNAGTAAPTVTSCGTGSVTSHSSNTAGEITATGATSCTVTFGLPNWTNTPFCIIEDETSAVAQRISAISTTAFTVTALTSGDKFMYHCIGGV